MKNLARISVWIGLCLMQGQVAYPKSSPRQTLEAKISDLTVTYSTGTIIITFTAPEAEATGKDIFIAL